MSFLRRCTRSLGPVAALVASLPAAAVRAEPLPLPPEVAGLRMHELSAALLEETNRVRREHGRRALKRRAELAAAADDQATFMALIGRAQHASAIRGQETPGDRVRRRGLEPRQLAENVAAYPVRPDEALNTPTAVAAALVAEWMASPPHRANLLSREFTHFGGAVRFAPVIRSVWAAYGVQVFAAVPSVR